MPPFCNYTVTKDNNATMVSLCYLQVNPWVFTRQKSQFYQWYSNWSSTHVTPDLQRSCDDWLLGVSLTGGDHSLTDKVIEEYNGQKCTTYRTS